MRPNLFPEVAPTTSNGITLAREGGRYHLSGTSTAYFEVSAKVAVAPGEVWMGLVDQNLGDQNVFAQDRHVRPWVNLLQVSTVGKPYTIPEGCTELVCGFVISTVGTTVDEWFEPMLWRVG